MRKNVEWDSIADIFYFHDIELYWLHDIRTTVGQVLVYFQSLHSIKQQVE